MSDDDDVEEAEEDAEEENGEEFVLSSGSGDIDLHDFNSDEDSIPIVQRNISQCQALLPNFEIEAESSLTFRIRFPSIVLPCSFAVVNEFDRHPTFLDLSVVLSDNSFKKSHLYEVTHPLFGVEFPGRPLIQTAVRSFFQEDYKPRDQYRSQLYLLWSDGTASDLVVDFLTSEGYDVHKARRAAVLTRNDIDAARAFLLTGSISFTPPPLTYTYAECPMLYLILEVMDAVLNLTDHCCVCGTKLGVTGVKPALCDNPLCEFGVARIGLGSTVMSDIRRDPMLADFLVYLAAAAYGTRFFRPPLPEKLDREAEKFFEELPPMENLKRFESDQDLMRVIGIPFYEILRFILMSNRAHLIFLPDQLAIVECKRHTIQFLSVVSALGYCGTDIHIHETFSLFCSGFYFPYRTFSSFLNYLLLSSNFAHDKRSLS